MGLADAMELDVVVTEPDVSLLAIQGPRAEDVVAAVFGENPRHPLLLLHRNRDPHPGGAAALGLVQAGRLRDLPLRRFAGRGLDPMWAAGETLLGENWGMNPNLIERIESGLFSWGTDFDEQNNPWCRGQVVRPRWRP